MKKKKSLIMGGIDKEILSQRSSHNNMFKKQIKRKK